MVVDGEDTRNDQRNELFYNILMISWVILARQPIISSNNYYLMGDWCLREDYYVVFLW